MSQDFPTVDDSSQNKMKKSEGPELSVLANTNESENFLRLMSPEVTVSRIFHANPHHNNMIPTCCRSPYTSGQENQEFRRQSAHAELMQLREPEAGGATSAGMNFQHQPPASFSLDPSESMQSGTRGECRCWACGPKDVGTKEPASRDTTRKHNNLLTFSGEDEFNCQSDAEEELEPPLPLRADNEWQPWNPFLIPHRYMHNHDLHHVVDVRNYNLAAEGECFNYNSVNRHFPEPSHRSPPGLHRRAQNEPQNWLQHHDSFMCDSVTVNVPQFSDPPVEGVSQVSVMNLNSAGAEESASRPQEKRRTISLPDQCRNIFITYSSDVSSEMVPFVDFLTKQGFRPAMDLFDSPIRRMDINHWKDSYLKDPATLIIIAISPKYKTDIEGSVVDNHGLHAKYVHSMMQTEYIQQGSLNFRFIPVLFLGASQTHVPCWLQNTRVYRWPKDTEDLLLRLLRVERYIPPPVPVELTLIIRPVNSSAAATL
ncbi:uncharacterized protein LOC111573250 isoform X1 [Amphiprion ocellaris]|uniref:uncharacterized protein LOC111573250 isoform X1 n=2 Tax=Amphiprion ocellaris TaxID=80972 RepID=UPI0024112895|nr:uncharacterized protein LOC111573250 isoform X1 [Amphiprion ocellaris]